MLRWAPPYLALLVIVLGGVGAGSAARAARGQGSIGVFTATDIDCSAWLGPCQVQGKFRAADDGRTVDAEWADTADNMRPGHHVIAIDSGRIYRSPGSRIWVTHAILLTTGTWIGMAWLGYMWLYGPRTARYGRNNHHRHT